MNFMSDLVELFPASGVILRLTSGALPHEPLAWVPVPVAPRCWRDGGGEDIALRAPRARAPSSRGGGNSSVPAGIRHGNSSASTLTRLRRVTCLGTVLPRPPGSKRLGSNGQTAATSCNLRTSLGGSASVAAKPFTPTRAGGNENKVIIC